MRILIISDIHANAAALEAVLSQADPHDAVWCLGDLVGYGPDPNECVARIRALPNLTCLSGNHDKAVLGEIDPDTFNDDARSVIIWTRNALSAENLDYLRELPVEELPLYRSWCLVQAKAKRLSPVAHAFLAFIRSERVQISALVERFDGKLSMQPAKS